MQQIVESTLALHEETSQEHLSVMALSEYVQHSNCQTVTYGTLVSLVGHYFLAPQRSSRTEEKSARLPSTSSYMFFASPDNVLQDLNFVPLNVTPQTSL